MKTARFNVEMIRRVAVRLAPLGERTAFLGGAATALLVFDPAAPDVRVTNDVDVIAETVSLEDYYNLEDIVTLLDGRPEVVSEHAAADRAVGQFISRAFAEFLGNRVFIDALPGHLPPDPASQQRIHLLLSRIQSIAQHASA